MAHDGEGPSPDEVRRRIDSLYDRAESDTGTFNATRAAAIPRQRGAVTRGRSEEDTQPAVGALARQWFDVARAKLGPSVPAWQSDRKVPVKPERAPEAARPARPAERPAERRALEAPPAERAAQLRAIEAPPASTGVAWELPSGSAQAPAAEAFPELSDQRANMVAAGEARLVESALPAGAQPGLDGDAAAWPLYEPAPAAALESGPQSLAVLPAVPAPAAVAYQADLLTSGTETYGAGPATGATALYATPLSGDLTAYHASVTPADMTTTTHGAGLPDTYGESWLTPTPTPTPTPVVGRSTQAERVIAFARAQIGLPCVWGAVGPGSYDAAGLAQAAWRTVGVTLPRTTQAQWSAGVQVPLTEVQAGDLVFFHDDLGHVGIWSGDGMMIHASGPGALIREESVFFAGQSAIKGAIRPA
ncbi:C40 family peptidase [Streptomyces collinus]|uniref:Cell wall-associated NlpC family hydrolase n=1 Tax=Streptomyces collinus TaxID=42684 RepID=A0AA89QIN4_STRCU|nr:NlpC/P60 family protein [Streptomyces collinus]MBB5816185.1 cell wall-associated NlpC family hydrolase [Streptomyces collinus]WMX69025.1 NlpC/P60 family protein [Streptomyces collinus]